MTRTHWGITNLDRKLPDGSAYPGSEVICVYWIAFQKEQGHTVKITGSIELAPAKPKNWTPYLSITKEMAVGWVQDALGAERVASIEAELTNEINEKLRPTHQLGLPWLVPDPLPPLPYSLGYKTPEV
jgi:hypothetical protein